MMGLCFHGGVQFAGWDYDPKRDPSCFCVPVGLHPSSVLTIHPSPGVPRGLCYSKLTLPSAGQARRTSEAARVAQVCAEGIFVVFTDRFMCQCERSVITS